MTLARTSAVVRPKPVMRMVVRAAHDNKDHWNKDRVNAFVGHSFPDFIEGWNRDSFKRVGYGMGATTVALGAGAMLVSPALAVPAVVLGGLSATYWAIGMNDIKQKSHAVRRNYPVLGNIRYIFETIRPEIYQYFVESDSSGAPYDRLHRAQVYQRAKNVDDTIPFGTRRDVYGVNHEWACHSMWPKEITDESAKRHTIGTAEYGTTKPYSASVLNVSAMSYGAISDNAILALNQGAKLGDFYHNTGEGGVSKYHLQGGGDIVWNIGTGYFGCGTPGEGNTRMFDPVQLIDTIQAAEGRIKMIEIKLSQGAKPGHGGILPLAKINREIAEARKIVYPATHDCHSPPQHSAFCTPHEMIEFIANVREAAGGIPVGIKMCVGQPGEVAALCKAMLDVGNGPDFISVDGAEGGTGAAPPELTNSVGLPLEEGLVLVRNLLVGAGLRDKVKINASGKISSGFSIIRNIALGADTTCAARAFMLSLGCIQALKCNTNKCPTGITTQNKDLMYGLDPEIKTHRVYHFHRKTVQAAAEIAGIMGYPTIHSVTSNDVMRRVQTNVVRTLSEHFPEVEPGSLVAGTAKRRLQEAWDNCSLDQATSNRRWIYSSLDFPKGG